MAKLRRGKTERDSIGYITAGRVEDLAQNLNQRDMQILELINRFKYINSEQIYKLIKPVEGFKAFNQLSTGRTRLNSRLRFLYDNHFINRGIPRLPLGEGTSPQYCWLDRCGNYILNDDIHKKVRDTLPIDYKHYSAIVDLFVYFSEINLYYKGKVMYYRNEPKLDTTRLIPDTICVLKSANLVSRNAKNFIIEIDRCYKKEKIEVEKIKEYAAWCLSDVWQKEEWFSICSTFPKIIYLMEGKYWRARANRIKKATSNLGLDIQFFPLQAYKNEEIFC